MQKIILPTIENIEKSQFPHTRIVYIYKQIHNIYTYNAYIYMYVTYIYNTYIHAYIHIYIYLYNHLEVQLTVSIFFNQFG